MIDLLSIAYISIGIAIVVYGSLKSYQYWKFYQLMKPLEGYYKARVNQDVIKIPVYEDWR